MQHTEAKQSCTLFPLQLQLLLQLVLLLLLYRFLLLVLLLCASLFSALHFARFVQRLSKTFCTTNIFQKWMRRWREITTAYGLGKTKAVKAAAPAAATDNEVAHRNV